MKVASLAGRRATRSFSSSSVWERSEGVGNHPRGPCSHQDPPAPASSLLPAQDPFPWAPKETWRSPGPAAVRQTPTQTLSISPGGAGLDQQVHWSTKWLCCILRAAVITPTGCKQSHELDAWLRTRPGWQERVRKESWQEKTPSGRTGSCAEGATPAPHLYGGGRHLPSLVEVQGDDLGEARGVAVHAGAAIAKSLQDGVESLPLLRCEETSGAVGCAWPAACTRRDE